MFTHLMALLEPVFQFTVKCRTEMSLSAFTGDECLSRHSSPVPALSDISVLQNVWMWDRSGMTLESVGALQWQSQLSPGIT